MINTHRIKSSDRFWILLFAALAAVCIAVMICLHFLADRTVAVIYQDGNEVCRVDLTAVRESYTIPLKGNTILVEPGAISMQSADCPDKLCIRQGTLHTVGQIVCLPNRVLIEMESDSGDKPDAKVG